MPDDATINPPRRATRTRSAGEVVTIVGRGTSQDEDDVLQQVQKGAYSKQIEDPFTKDGLYSLGTVGDLQIIQPPVNVAALLRMPNDNSILRQCIESMVINVEGHGYRLEYTGPDGQNQSTEAQTEYNHIIEYLETLHPELSLIELRKRIRWDIETLGFSYIALPTWTL